MPDLSNDAKDLLIKLQMEINKHIDREIVRKFRDLPDEAFTHEA